MSIRRRRRDAFSWLVTLVAAVLALSSLAIATGHEEVRVATPTVGSYNYEAAQQVSVDAFARWVAVVRTAGAAHWSMRA